MNEARAIARCEEAAALLPPRFRRAALQMPDHRKRYTEEFRLRAGQPPAALLPEGEVTLPYFGADSRVTPRDLAQMVDAVTDYSRYACAETLRQGFLCLHGGFRLGVCGTAVLRNGAVASLRDISSLSLRIVTERIACRADGRQPVLRGSLPEHAPALAAGRRQDDAFARPHPHALARKRESRGAARRGGGRARRDRRLRRRRGADGIGDAHGRAHALPQGAGHRHGAAGDEPAGHRRSMRSRRPRTLRRWRTPQTAARRACDDARRRP